jgi:tRNA-dihydrouridine synthase A
MMDWTDRHCRYFLRGFSSRVLLYTEMITAAAIVHGDRARLLRFDPEEQPVALQLGGSDPTALAFAARAAEEMGYREINLNCGCPSDRVHSGSFGACLMQQPEQVALCVAGMRAAVKIPVTVKMRIGIVIGKQHGTSTSIQSFDEGDFEALRTFTLTVAEAGCETFIVHARKAVLGGLSPKENREVPPLHYEAVQRLKRELPQLQIVVNGGLRTRDEVVDALQWCDGAMLGREAYHRPYVLSELHEALYPQDAHANVSREALLERMARYAARELSHGERLSAITRHMLGLYAGEPGAKEFRRLLSEGARGPGAGPELLLRAAKICGRFPSEAF